MGGKGKATDYSHQNVDLFDQKLLNVESNVDHLSDIQIREILTQ